MACVSDQGGQTIYNGDYIVYGFDDYLGYMTEFIDVVAGRTEIFFCPVDETWRPFLEAPGWVDPDVASQLLDDWRRYASEDQRPDVIAIGVDPTRGWPPQEVIGVVADVRNTLEREPMPA